MYISVYAGGSNWFDVTAWLNLQHKYTYRHFTMFVLVFPVEVWEAKLHFSPQLTYVDRDALLVSACTYTLYAYCLQCKTTS